MINSTDVCPDLPLFTVAYYNLYGLQGWRAREKRLSLLAALLTGLLLIFR